MPHGLGSFSLHSSLHTTIDELPLHTQKLPQINLTLHHKHTFGILSSGPALRASSLLPTPIPTNPIRKLCLFSKLLNKASSLPVSRTRSKYRNVRFSSPHDFFSARARGLLQPPISIPHSILYSYVILAWSLHDIVRLYVERMAGWRS